MKYFSLVDNTAVCNAAAEVVALVQTLVLFHRDDDAQRVQTHFDRYLRIISDAFYDIWSPNTSIFATSDRVVWLNC